MGVQGEPEAAFERRMYTYYQRILSRYKIEVVSLAVLADTDPHFKPSHYQTERFGCQLHFTFPSVKLLDWENRWEELEASHNRFAPVVMAQILAKRLHPKNQAQERKTVKLKLVKSLFHKGYSRTDILELLRVIDWMINLPYTLEEEFTQELAAYEEADIMPYITSFERRGIEKGIEQGYQKAQAEAEKRLQEEKQAAEKRLQEMVLSMLQVGLPDSQVMGIAQITADELAAIKEQQTRH